MRISGVPVGRVKKKEPNKETGLTETELEIDARYAPIPKDTRRSCARRRCSARPTWTCRPGGRVGPDPRRWPAAGGQVAETVELDEILRTFDPVTREKFSIWLDQSGQAAVGNAEGLNDALGLLTPFAEETDDVLEVLRVQSGATRRFIRDTGVVFDALSARKGQLRDLIRNSNRVWSTVADRDEQLADTFRVLPTFLREGRTTTRRLTRFAENTDPLITQLRPAARQLSPLLVDLDGLAPDLKGLFDDLGPYVPIARKGLPATEQVLDNTEPLLARLDPFLRQLTPIVDYLGLYKREIAAFLANDSAATQARARRADGTGNPIHYLRTSARSTRR